MFLNSFFQKSDHLPPSRKIPSIRHPLPNFYCLRQRLTLLLNNIFHVKPQNSICSCSHCSCTFFILPLYSLHIQVILILILINVQYLQISVFSFEKGLKGQKHSSDSHRPTKQSPSPKQNLLFLPHPLQ